jgi:hypothetical protein
LFTVECKKAELMQSMDRHIVQTCQLPEARFATVELAPKWCHGLTRLLADEFFMLSKENSERLMHTIAACDG